MRHGAEVKHCSSEGCTNKVVKGGVCIKHGAKDKRCSCEGCANRAAKGGVCVRHGAKPKIDYAAAKDALIKPNEMDCAEGTGQKNYAAMKDVQTLS